MPSILGMLQQSCIEGAARRTDARANAVEYICLKWDGRLIDGRYAGHIGKGTGACAVACD
jgi:hypothetical protein